MEFKEGFYISKKNNEEIILIVFDDENEKWVIDSTSIKNKPASHKDLAANYDYIQYPKAYSENNSGVASDFIKYKISTFTNRQLEAILEPFY